MARISFGDKEVQNLLRKIELNLTSGVDVKTACGTADLNDSTYYNWREKYGVESMLSMGKSRLREMKKLEMQNAEMKKIVAKLELDKLILKQTLDFLEPKV